MPSRCIILAGAPLVEHLDWAEASLRQTNLTDETAWLVSSSTGSVSIDDSRPRWRAIDIDSHGPALDNQWPHRQYAFEQESLNESILLLEQMEASGMSPKKLISMNGSFADDTDEPSFLTTSGSLDESSDITTAIEAANNAMNATFTDLQRLPDAAYIKRINPQTVTVDLLVTIIAIRPTKTVQLRRRPGHMDIVELVVGDETRSGFGVNIWLTPSHSEHDSLRDTVQSLRSGDLLMISNLALSAYQDVVCGQTLGKHFARNSTTLTKVSKRTAASADPGKKVRRVYDWSMHFLAPFDETVKQAVGGRSTRILPPDSQSQ